VFRDSNQAGRGGWEVEKRRDAHGDGAGVDVGDKKMRIQTHQHANSKFQPGYPPAY
jgi:hypothetical protein